MMGDNDRLHLSTPGPAFDAVDTLARVAGDRELLTELIEIIRAESPRVLSEIDRCVTSGDADGLERATHRLRGSVGVFGAQSVTRAALELELMAHTRHLTGAALKLAELRQALDRLNSDLATFSEDGSL
jgi:HPt (histidine-containing phosphotransfer) domain-containing protein